MLDPFRFLLIAIFGWINQRQLLIETVDGRFDAHVARIRQRKEKERKERK